MSISRPSTGNNIEGNGVEYLLGLAAVSPWCGLWGHIKEEAMAEHGMPPVGEERDKVLALAMGWWIDIEKGTWEPITGWQEWRFRRGVPAWSTDPALLPELLRFIDGKGWGCTLEHLAPTELYSSTPMTYSCMIRGETIAYGESYSDAVTAALLRALEAEKGVSDG